MSYDDSDVWSVIRWLQARVDKAEKDASPDLLAKLQHLESQARVRHQSENERVRDLQDRMQVLSDKNRELRDGFTRACESLKQQEAEIQRVYAEKAELLKAIEKLRGPS